MVTEISAVRVVMSMFVEIVDTKKPITVSIARKMKNSAQQKINWRFTTGNMNNPFHYAIVWRGNSSNLVGAIIDIDEYKDLLKKRYTLHSITGRTATVCLISQDETITRNEKLNFAIMFMAGKYKTIHVDLNKLTSKTTYPS